ncbi:MAG: ATP-binding protein [Rickettsiales bacterium]|jgi:predicted AAA+ superfamily ATPase|nr:ATP-binding protein [Rickettsiales bacterium]
MQFLQREMSSILSETVKQRPLVYLNGPRQVGKSWLSRNFASPKDTNFISFDSPLVLMNAKSSPEAFVRSLPKDKLNVIDEVQMAPEIFMPLKIAVDEARMRGESWGQFLLTGSANLMAIPALSEALVGRMAILTLWQISSSEYKQSGINFIEKLFDDELFYKKYDNYELLGIMANSTFPELSKQSVQAQGVFGFAEDSVSSRINRSTWFDGYLTTILQRDVKTVANIRKPENVLKLLTVLTIYAGSILNNTNAARESELHFDTYNDYKSFLINTFLIYELRAWTKPNRIGKMVSRQSKLFFTDTNLLLYIMRRELKDVSNHDRPMMGHLFENFIATEIIKNKSSLTGMDLSYFRTSDGREVDFVLEKYNGDTIGIEVKLDSMLSEKDFRGLKVLKSMVGEKFKKGVVIYSGNEILSFGNGMWAVPVCYLWWG